jgi:hypothetical protein
MGVVFIPATRRKKQWSYCDEGGLTALFDCFGKMRHREDAVALPLQVRVMIRIAAQP